jgi:hypothetical protein
LPPRPSPSVSCPPTCNWDYLDERSNSVQQEGYRHDYRYVLRLDEEAGPGIQVVIEMPAR